MPVTFGAGPSISNYPFGFAYGVAVQGMPILNTYNSSATVWWVSSTTGADGNEGSLRRPFATLARAFAKANADQGDIIMVAPLHAETISSSTALSLNVTAVSVIGLGVGSHRPTFTLDTGATTTINVSAKNISVTNCLFVANFADITALFTIANAPGFSLIGCEFRDTSAVLNFLSTVKTSTTNNQADDLTIAGCKRVGAGATANTNLIALNGSLARLVVRDSYVAHKATTRAGLINCASGKLLTDAIIDNNKINLVGNSGAATGVLIITDQTTHSGIISNNFAQSLSAAAPVLVTASSGFIFDQNFYASATDHSGALLPAV